MIQETMDGNKLEHIYKNGAFLKRFVLTMLKKLK